MPKLVDWEARFQAAIDDAPLCACGCGERMTPSPAALKVWQKRGGTQYHYREFRPGHQNRNTIVELSDDEYQVLAGSVLGDGCIYRKRGTYAPHFIENHGPKQEEYVKWKAVQLASLDPIVTYHKNGGYGDQHVRVCTKSNYALTWLLENRYPEPSSMLINSLEPLGIAVWFMDDGTSGHDRVRICTNGRDVGTLIKMQKMFKNKFGLTSVVNKASPGYVLAFKGESREAFCELIRPHVIPSMEYKLDWKLKKA